MENNTNYVHLETKIAKIKATEWDYDFDPDEVLKIDYSNLFGEIVTIPVLVNRMGQMSAEMKGYVKRQKMELQLQEASVRKLFRNKCSEDGIKKPTLQQEEDHLCSDPKIKNFRFKIIRLEEDSSKIEVLYEATKDKSFKLNNLSKNLTPSDLENELIEGVVNGVFIELKNKRFR